MDKINGQTMDIVKDNIDKLKEIFPDVFREGKIDFDALRINLGDSVEVEKERYSFNWNGKQEAKEIALTPSNGTLRPDKESSKNWENTGNLYIEGDNLEVLKLLQKSYHNKIKMIYIDPPYNTGKDFVYKDNFRDNIKNYKEVTGQVDNEGNKLSTNSDQSGRYHSDWLNMMYPRLKLARNLLKDDGVIFISIDDNEINNLTKICDEVFGEDNFVEVLVWKRRATAPNDRVIGRNHEYILCYAKTKENLSLYLQPRDEKLNSRYSNPDHDIRGPWVASDLSANGKGGRLTESCIYDIMNPSTGENFGPPQNKCWLYNKEKMNILIQEGRIGFREKSGTPFLKRYLSEVRQGSTLPTILDSHGYSQDSAKEIKNLFNRDVFDFPKPIKLLKTLLTCGLSNSEIILDFFSGSAASAHATMDLNSDDGGDRKFIMVQLPEPTGKKTEAFKDGYKNICEIGKERIRRAGEKIVSSGESQVENLDIGFKVFKLDTSNIKEWDSEYATKNLQTSLLDYVDNIKEGRSEEDILYELLLKHGLDLTTPIMEINVNEKIIYNIGAGALYICLASGIDRSIAEGIIDENNAWKTSRVTVIFKDTGFNSDKDKTNVIQTLKIAGIIDVKSV